MIGYDEIKHIELELSSYCNASCSLCPRNLFGYNTDLGYPKRNLSLEEIKKIVSVDFLQQLEHVKFEGNFGDPLSNPEVLDIIKYFNVPVTITTNGFYRNKEFWQHLAKLDVEVQFGIDGIDQSTHSRYRRGTNFDRILANACTYIEHGGNATWKMIKFDFNVDQIETAKTLSQKLGFKKFILIEHGRTSGPVFDQNGKLIDILGNWQGSTSFEKIKQQVDSGKVLLEDINQPKVDCISCQSVNHKSIYISSDGYVYPCCFMGFSPSTYGRGRWHQPVNQQLVPLIKDNNALVHGLEHAVKWFNRVSLVPGDLVVCDASCGHNQ